MMTAKEALTKMPQAFNSEAAGDTDAVVQYNISEPMYHVIKDGQVQVHEGQAENPNLTVDMADDDLVQLFQGELNGMSAFMSGKIKVTGDMMLAQKLVGFVDQEKLG